MWLTCIGEQWLSSARHNARDQSVHLKVETHRDLFCWTCYTQCWQHTIQKNKGRKTERWCKDALSLWLNVWISKKHFFKVQINVNWAHCCGSGSGWLWTETMQVYVGSGLIYFGLIKTLVQGSTMWVFGAFYDLTLQYIEYWCVLDCCQTNKKFYVTLFSKILQRKLVVDQIIHQIIKK